MNVTKRCSHCGEFKPKTEFGKLHTQPDGLNYTCKSCCKAFAFARRDKQREYGIGYRAKHKDRLQKRSHKYFMEHHEDMLKFMRQHYQANKKQISEWSKNKYVSDSTFRNKRKLHARAMKAGLDDKTYRSAVYVNLVLQDGNCAICYRPIWQGDFRLDHDHKTGAIRGLLCDKCNAAIGFLKDNPDYCRNAALYLDNNKTLRKIDG